MMPDCVPEMKRWDQQAPRPFLQFKLAAPPLLPLRNVQANQWFPTNMQTHLGGPPPPDPQEDPIHDPVVSSMQRNLNYNQGNNSRDSVHPQRQIYGNPPSEPFRHPYQNQYRLPYPAYQDPYRKPYQGSYREPYQGRYRKPYRGSHREAYQGSHRQRRGRGPSHQTREVPYVVLNGNDWIDPSSAQQVAASAEKTEEEKTPLPGSAEERERTLKEKSEWLKKRMKDKDLTAMESRLELIKRQKASEPQQESKNKSLYVPVETSVLESDCLETVKKNLGDGLPDGGNLLTSLLKETETVTRVQTARGGNPNPEVVNVEDLPSRILRKQAFESDRKRSGISSVDRQRGLRAPVERARGNASADDPSHVESTPVPKIVTLLSSCRPYSTETRIVPSFEKADEDVTVLDSSHVESTSVPKIVSLLSPSRPHLTETRIVPSFEKTEDDVSVLDSSHVEYVSVPETVPASSLANLTSTNRGKRESLLECVSKLAGIPKIKDLSQLKSFIEHPRPGKFEHYLNEQIKKYRLSSCRAVHLSDKSFTHNENVDIQEPQAIKTEDVPRQGNFSSEDLMSCLGKWSECDVRMEDLPFEFIQELGELLELDVTTPIHFDQNVDQGSGDTPDPTVERSEIVVPTSSTKPGIRVKDFASLCAPTLASSQTLDTIDTLVVAPATSPAGRPAGPSAAPPAASPVAIPVPHPLDGPNLLAACYQNKNMTVPTSTPNSPVSFLSNGPYRRRKSNILAGDVFFSGESNGKRGNKQAKSPSQNSRKKSVDVVKPLVGADGNSVGLPKELPSPDSMGCGEERQIQGTSLAARGSAKVAPFALCKKVASASELSEDEFRAQTNSDPKDEASILKRIQEILTEITHLNEKLGLLEEEKDHMYNLLQKVRKPAKKRTVTEDSEEEEVRRRILSHVCADLEKSNDFDYKTRKKKSSKKARPITSPGSKSKKAVLPAISTETAVLPTSREQEPQRGAPPLAHRETIPPKGTLAFFGQNVSLSCDKEMLPKDIGIVTQLKVIRKSILASSANGKIYSISSSTGKIKKTFDCGALPVKCFCLAETKNQLTVLVGGTEDGKLHCFKLLSGDKLNKPISVTNDINCVDSKWGLVYIGSKSGSIIKYDISRNKSTALTAENGVIYGIKCASEGPRKVLVCASSKWGLELRNAKDALLLRRFVNWDGNSSPWGAPEYKYAVDLTTDRVAFSKTGEVHILEFTNPQGTVLYKTASHVSCMHLSQGILFVGCKDGSIRRFNVQNYEVLPPLTVNRENVVCMDVVDNQIILARKGGVFDIITFPPR